jgi:hypothetical protein
MGTERPRSTVRRSGRLARNMKLSHEDDHISWAEIAAGLLSAVVPYLVSQEQWPFAHLEWQSREMFAIASCVPSSASFLVDVLRRTELRCENVVRLLFIVFCCGIGWHTVILSIASHHGHGFGDISRVRRWSVRCE